MAAKLKDGLFIGDYEAAHDYEFLMTNKITHIINCAGREVENGWESLGVRYLTFLWTDSDNFVIFDSQGKVVEEIFRFVEEALARHEGILIHSVDGVSRACSCCAAYFMRKYHWDLDKTMQFLTSKRPDLCPIPNFYRQLLYLDQRLHQQFAALYPSEQTARAKRSEWSIAAVGDTSDAEEEAMLVNTFLNSQPAEPPLRQSPAKPRKQRGIRWIDQSMAPGPRASAQGAGAPERPPTASYNSLRAGPGWVDTIRPTPSQTHGTESPSPQRPLRSILRTSAQRGKAIVFGAPPERAGGSDRRPHSAEAKLEPEPRSAPVRRGEEKVGERHVSTVAPAPGVAEAKQAVRAPPPPPPQQQQQQQPRTAWSEDVQVEEEAEGARGEAKLDTGRRAPQLAQGPESDTRRSSRRGRPQAPPAAPPAPAPAPARTAWQASEGSGRGSAAPVSRPGGAGPTLLELAEAPLEEAFDPGQANGHAPAPRAEQGARGMRVRGAVPPPAAPPAGERRREGEAKSSGDRPVRADANGRGSVRVGSSAGHRRGVASAEEGEGVEALDGTAPRSLTAARVRGSSQRRERPGPDGGARSAAAPLDGDGRVGADTVPSYDAQQVLQRAIAASRQQISAARGSVSSDRAGPAAEAGPPSSSSLPLRRGRHGSPAPTRGWATRGSAAAPSPSAGRREHGLEPGSKPAPGAGRRAQPAPGTSVRRPDAPVVVGRAAQQPEAQPSLSRPDGEDVIARYYAHLQQQQQQQQQQQRGPAPQGRTARPGEQPVSLSASQRGGGGGGGGMSYLERQRARMGGARPAAADERGVGAVPATAGRGARNGGGVGDSRRGPTSLSASTSGALRGSSLHAGGEGGDGAEMRRSLRRGPVGARVDFGPSHQLRPAQDGAPFSSTRRPGERREVAMRPGDRAGRRPASATRARPRSADLQASSLRDSHDGDLGVRGSVRSASPGPGPDRSTRASRARAEAIERAQMAARQRREGVRAPEFSTTRRRAATPPPRRPPQGVDGTPYGASERQMRGGQLRARPGRQPDLNATAGAELFSSLRGASPSETIRLRRSASPMPRSRPRWR